MRQLLSNLERNRWNWITKGIEEFREGFLRLSPSQSEKEEVLIGVYGPTQVGKTTLILKVLGVREDKMRELSGALRGKRVVGNSATITATVYHKSPDDTFSIVYPNGDTQFFSSLEEFEEGMEAVRLAVEVTSNYSIRPIHVYFSESYFNLIEVDSRSRDITILDLPGDDSREAREVDHVERCLKEYLPHCRLCIVMEIGGQMVNLTQITREHLRDWSYLPEQFRIVLTRTLTSSSVRENVQNGVIHSTESYISHFKKELNRLLEDNREVQRIYPLEMGDSWNDLKNNDEDFYHLISPWISEVYEQLLDDIKSIESPEREVMQLLNLEDLAHKRKSEEVEVYNKRMEKEERRLGELKAYAKVLTKKYKQLDKEIEELRDLASELDQYKQIDLPSIYDIPSWSYRTYHGRSVASLKGDYVDGLNHLRDGFNDSLRRWNQSIRLLTETYYLPFSPIAFPHDTEKDTIYIDRFFERYFLKNSFQEDLAYCERKLEKSRERIMEKINKESSSKLKKIVNERDKLIKYKELLKQQHMESIDKISTECGELVKILSDLKKSLEQTRREWDHDIQRTNELYRYLKKSFTQEVNFFRSKLQSPNVSNEEKWAYHLYWNIIDKDSERIIQYDDSRTII